MEVKDCGTILIAEEDEGSCAFLAEQLAADGYEPLVARTKEHMRVLARTRCADLLVLGDLELRRDSIGLLCELRTGQMGNGELDPQLPVVILSSDGSELGKLRGFEAGCDDYLEKSFGYAELRARIEAVLRRCRERGRQGRVRVGKLAIDPSERRVRYGEAEVALSNKEFALLERLASDSTRVFTKEELLRDVWGYKAMGSTRTLDSHASRLRRKLAAAGARGLVVNVWGVGYRLQDGLAAATPDGRAA